MKKSIFSLAAVAAMTVACSVEDVNENQAPVGELFTIEAAIATTQPAPDSKTTLTVDGTAYKVEWDDGETLSVVTKSSDGTSAGNEFTKGDGNSFSGNVAEPENVTDVYVVYPYSKYHNSYNQEHDNINGYITIGSTNTGAQTQNGINSTAHVKGNLYGYAQVLDGTASVQMHHATTLFEIIVTNSTDADLSVSKIVLGNSESDDMVGNFYIAPQNGTLSSYRVSASATLNVTGANTITSGNTGKFYIVSAPFELAADATLSVGITMSDGAVYNIDKTISSADLGKFAAGAVNHINAEITEVPEVEKIEDGEYLIAACTDNGWAVMTAINQKSEFFEAEDIVNISKQIDNISCSDFYIIPTITNDVWIIKSADNGYTIQSKTTSKFLSFNGENAEEIDSQAILSAYPNEDGTYSISNDASYVLKYNISASRFKPYSTSFTGPSVVLIPWVEDTTPRIFVNETSKTVNYDATSVEFEYTTNNISGNITATETDPDNIISAISTENGTVSVTLAPNTEEREKTATIELSYTGAESVILTVKQNAAPGASSKYYVKVTEEPADWSGQYLIVFEEESRIYRGSLTSTFQGSTNVQNYYDVFISSNQILSNSDIDANSVTIENHSGAYAIKTASGYYISRNNDSNGVDGDLEYSSECNVTFEMDGSNIKIAGNGGRILLHNGTNDPNYIRFYSSSNWDKAGYTKPSLYKLQ